MTKPFLEEMEQDFKLAWYAMEGDKPVTSLAAWVWTQEILQRFVEVAVGEMEKEIERAEKMQGEYENDIPKASHAVTHFSIAQSIIKELIHE